jgi:hypothetical protein
MRPNGLRLAAALVLAAAAFIAPMSAWADKAPEITKESRTKGMAAAPGVIASAGLECQLADARFIGEAKDEKTKVKHSYYELACTGSEGYIVQTSSVETEAPSAFTCVESKTAPTHCILPGNADTEAGMAPFVTKAVSACTPDGIRPIGHNNTAFFFEAHCKEGLGGFMIQTSEPPRTDKPIVANPCIQYSETSNLSCKLTDRAAQYVYIDQMPSKAGKDCVARDRAYIGATRTNVSYYEVACSNGKGYMLEVQPDGKVSRAIDCVEADTIANGCKLTDTREAKSEAANLYTKLSRAAGFACDVSRYAPLPSSKTGQEVVELACKNRPDGAIGIFGASTADSKVYDCAHSEIKGYRCSLTKPDASYSLLTADLKTLNKNSCAVSAARYVGETNDGTGLMEVACSDGLQGYMIEYAAATLTPKTTIVCSEAKGIGGGCTLPGNTKK